MRKNLDLNIEEINEHKVRLESLPYKFYLEITQRCNLKCIMCDQPNFSLENKDFPVDLFEKIKPYLRQAEEVDFYFVGESTLSKNLIPFLEDTKSFDFLPKIFTNGTILNDEILNTFDTRGVFVNISIEAATPEIYEQIRVGASFKHYKSNIKKYVDRYDSRTNDRFHIRLSCTSAIDNISEILNIIEFAQEMGIRDLFFGAIDNSTFSNRHLSVDDKKAVYYLKKEKNWPINIRSDLLVPEKLGIKLLRLIIIGKILNYQ